MRRRRSNRNFDGLKPARINQISALLLAIGFGSALIIYLTAQPVVIDPVLGDPLNNKKYLRELRVIGGKANVLAAEFIAWFDDRWRGRNLSGTVAVLTVMVTLAFRFVAARPDIYAPSRVGDGKTSSGPS